MNYKHKQCEATTKKGAQCKVGAMKGSDFCGLHFYLTLELKPQAQIANKEEWGTIRVYNKREANIPQDAVYVGRPTKWGNPFSHRSDTKAEHVVASREDAVAMYRVWVQQQPELVAALPELQGKDLVCWCAPESCHADVLIELANNITEEEIVEEETYIAILGHRPDKLGGYRADVSHLEAEVKRVIGKIPGNLVDLCGGAQGADQIGARVFYREGLPYILIKPFEGQEKRWPKKAQEKYANLETHARKTIVVSHINSKNYHEVVKALYKRNQFMIDKADYVVAIWNGDKKGGTAHAMRYAKAQGKTTIIIQVDGQGKHVRTVRRDH